MVSTSLFSIALTLFLVANPIGNTPVILALIKDYSFERQKIIMLREAFFAFLIAIFFQLVGEYFLDFIHVKQYSLSLCGGALLFLVSLKMIFPSHTSAEAGALQQEPFFVPIATPLVTGPGCMTIIMIFSRQETSVLKISGAITLAFLGVGIVLFAGPYLNRILGRRGMVALEQLMGMVLSMISMQMIVKGAALFWQELVRA